MGTIFVPLNAMFGRFELEQIAADADCTAVLSTPALIAKLGVDGTGKSPDELRIFDLRVPGSSTAYDAIVARGRNFEDARLSADDELGRAACRERVCQYVEILVGAVSFKKKKKRNK